MNIFAAVKSCHFIADGITWLRNLYRLLHFIFLLIQILQKSVYEKTNPSDACDDVVFALFRSLRSA
ncbi:MAG: hypothetical protein K2L57_06865, partial [Muribaculaceae bacterium]|nr:hypothetical protein [Muribaculaceae bacterium]